MSKLTFLLFLLKNKQNIANSSVLAMYTMINLCYVMLLLRELLCWIAGGLPCSAFACGHMPEGSSQTRQDKHYTSPIANQEHIISQICL